MRTAHTISLFAIALLAACGGVLEANYWSLGSDFRGCGSASYTLSYMSPMAGLRDRGVAKSLKALPTPRFFQSKRISKVFPTTTASG